MARVCHAGMILRLISISTYVLGFLCIFLDATPNDTIEFEIRGSGTTRTTTLKLTQCTNFPLDLVGEDFSIASKQFCVRKYENWNCSGFSAEITTNSQFHANLKLFKEGPKSFGRCRLSHSCEPEVIGRLPKTVLHAELYSKKNFAGAQTSVEIAGCTQIPNGFIRRVQSVNSSGQCLELYSDYECRTKDKIALIPRTSIHLDLALWGFTEARSIAHCAFNCNPVRRHQTTQIYGQLNQSHVAIFDEPSFKGNSLLLEVTGCLTLDRDWEGLVESIQFHNQSQYTLYELRDCGGESLNLVSSRQQFADRNFVVRSIKPGGSKDSGSNPLTSPGLLVTLGVLLLIMIVLISVVSYLMKRNKRYRQMVSFLSPREIDEFMKGRQVDLTPAQASGDYMVELMAQNQPYDENYEIARENIHCDYTHPLGSGEFGTVYQGFVIKTNKDGTYGHLPGQNNSTTPVAVKTVKPNAEGQHLRTFMKEVKVLIHIGVHPRIVRMVGCCTKNLRQGEILVLMEFCEKGCLEAFLQNHRLAFRNIVRDDGDIYTALPGDSGSGQGEPPKLPDAFDIRQLMKWCIEVAEGMEFLASKNVIHGDLATRNILLDLEYKAKISDFGLSKQLSYYSEYIKKHQEPLPWRWLAIESIRSMTFSTKSDVWSYGVLCWEIFTLGQKPFPFDTWSDEFAKELENGKRLPIPKYATTECYDLLTKCWANQPEGRPTFSEIFVEFQDIFIALKK